jgi:mannose-6-phosphate isomerase-like protein (cupin superfamily)
MRFPWKNVKIKTLTKDLKVYEYCHEVVNLPIDAAIAELDGKFGPKINKNFTELFFIISGKLTIVDNNNTVELNNRDVYMIQPGHKHILYGEKCSLFISCTPQFDLGNVDFVDEEKSGV